MRREEVDHSVDRLGHVRGVKRRYDEVTGLRGLQSGLDRVGVTDLTDEDDIRVLAHRRPQRGGEAVCVQTDLALIDDRFAIGMEDLDRVFDRQDVTRARSVDVVDHRPGGRRLPRRRRSRDQDQPAVLGCQGLDYRR
jgi:hypothetical protein